LVSTTSEQRRTLDAKLAALGSAFADAAQLVSASDVKMLVTLRHVAALCVRFVLLVNYVEWLLEKQLIAAVGKTLTAADFGRYMQYHARKVFAREYAPTPFVHPVRRADHVPEGELCINADLRDGALPQPLVTMSCMRVASAAQSIYFGLSAGAKARFSGEQTVHGALMFQFDDSSVSLQLVARARQFSSFVLLVGTMASANTFSATHALIVQNKDEVRKCGGGGGGGGGGGAVSV
jgi:hypothetical protein